MMNWLLLVWCPIVMSTGLHKVEPISQKFISEVSDIAHHHIMITEFFKTVKLSVSQNDRLSIREGETDLGCVKHPSVAAMKFLERICEDCYKIYRDFDIFHMCR